MPPILPKGYVSVANQKKTPAASTQKKKSAAPQKGNSGNNRTAKPSPAAGKKTAKSAPKSAPAAPVREKKPPNPDRILHQVIPYILAVAALFLLICFILTDAVRLEQPMGVVGHWLHSLLCGLWSWGAFYIPLLLVYFAIVWRRSVGDGTLGYKLLFAFLCLTFCSALVETFAIRAIGGEVPGINPVTLWQAGCALQGGGVIGGLVGNLCFRGFGFVGTLIVVIALLLVFIMLLFGLTPSAIVLYVRYWIKVREEKKRERENQTPVFISRPRFPEPVPAAEPQPVPEKPGKRRKKFDVDVPINSTGKIEDIDLPIPDLPEAPLPDDGDVPEENPIDPAIFDEVMAETRSEQPAVQDDPFVGDVTAIATEGVEGREKIKPTRGKSSARQLAEAADEQLDLHKIFADPTALDKAAEAAMNPPSADGEGIAADGEIMLDVERTVPFGTPSPVASPNFVMPPPSYVFPPVTLLKVDPAPPSGDVRAELQQNAEKLVETLSSFNVRTKIVNVSRGPTITRYELQPEAGTRVRSIANLVDDIALNLATTGVRIEAPIPGKAAVGIEVPNKVVATVYARELIESEAFQSAKSRLTACLGRDVAGAPIYCDLAKMPHLLIAGTTGSGKSVCINSILLSILYKASPDEVKLILIDPKKVELNVYNGIPHLLVPVVSDPKKAAGSLNWAVGEMERRYELIEDAGVRNLQGYNAYIESHPERGEKLHQIVIVIDELADLMMTAKDDVETSICRIAQKARAAGMHLVIGTQRPSVDVITGLIKANVPSRIAFTTVSQVDSRTIIDIAGAEKLIGRGDMLYSPVGSTRPVRVQGAFVSDSEVESVIDFIKNNSGEGEYSEEVIESIEKEAARCGQSKKGGGSSLEDIEAEAADEPADPMLRPAIELAIECGKISTSLIQRRLSLGYGRAAKLIDRMERLGYVSAPDGQKPRDVLITRQQFMEMVVRDEDLG